MLLSSPSPLPSGRVARGVGDSYCDFFGNLVALLFCIVFRCLFGSILAPVSLPTCSPKSIKIKKKRCQVSINLGLRFLIDFWSVLALNFHPEILIFLAPAAAGARIIKNRFSNLTSIFDPILVPTWLHFGTKNQPNFVHQSTPRGIKKTIDFCIDFLSMFDRFGNPTWSHVGRFFGPARRTL